MSGSSFLLPLWIVLVETAHHLLAEPARRDVLAQQRARPVLVVTELAMQHLGDREAGVEADQIGELERPHRMIEAELDTGIDIARGAQAFIEPIASFVE